MSDSENSSIAFVGQQGTVSARRRLQNRVAQRKFRELTLVTERQKNKASAGEGTSTAQHEASNVLPSNNLDAMSSQDSYSHPETSPFSRPGNVGPSSSGLYTPAQWWMPSACSLPSSPQIPHSLGATPENVARPTSSQSDGTFADLPGSTKSQYCKQYLQNPAALLAYSSDFEHTEPNPFVPGDTLIGNPAYSAVLKAPSPSSSSFATSYIPSGSFSAASPSAIDQLCPTQSSSANHGDAQTNAPLLHVAIRTHKKSMVGLLLRRSVTDVNERDTHGRTALHVAAQSGDEGMVLLLLKHGADPEAMDGNGLDALRLAVEHGREEIVEILLDAIAQRE